MRSILTFVVVVLLALGAYKFFAKSPSDGVTKTPQNTPNYQRPQVDRPQVGQVDVEAPANTGPMVGPELEPENAAFTWGDQVSDKYLVTVEEAWRVDVDKVDLAADTLVTVDGVAITQRMFREWVAVKHGQAIINSRYFEAMGRLAAAEKGVEYGMSDADWAIYFEEWLALKGQSREYALNFQASKLTITLEQVEPVRRRSVEAMLAMFPPVETVDDLPIGLADYFTTEQDRQQAAVLGNFMRDAIEQMAENQGRPKAPVPAVVDPMSLLFNRVGTSMRFQRGWDALYRDMPDGMVAGMYLGELPDDTILPPWAYDGEMMYVTLDEVWGAVAPVLTDGILRDDLREVIWFQVLKAKLAAAGKLPTADEHWREFAAVYLEKERTFFNFDLDVSTDGYPTRSVAVADMLIDMGFERSQEEGWMDEEALRAYFDECGFFIKGWEPMLEMVLFTPFDPTVHQFGEVDWERAKQQAEAFRAEVEAGGEFSSMRVEHNQKLVEAHRNLSQELGDALAAELKDGRFHAAPAVINRVMRQGEWQERLAGYDVLRNAIFRLQPGEMSPVWKTEVGYVILRMNTARMGRLEREYEDLIETTEYFYRAWRFRDWVTSQLSGAVVE